MQIKSATLDGSLFKSTPVGTLQIPTDFDYRDWMEEFIQSYKHQSPHFAISEKNIREPFHVPKPGSKVSVSIVEQTVSKTTTEDRLKFLRSQNSLMFGEVGAALCLYQLFRLLPTGKDIYAFDEKSHLRQDCLPQQVGHGNHRIPKIYLYRGKNESYFFYFEEGYFVLNGEWSKEALFFQFKEFE
jgi:hypothetical protein